MTMSVPLPHVAQPSSPTEYVLTISCPDRPGLVADVTRYIFESGGNIVESQQFEDRLTTRFFMRVHFVTVSGGTGPDELRTSFAPIATPTGPSSWCPSSGTV